MTQVHPSTWKCKIGAPTIGPDTEPQRCSLPRMHRGAHRVEAGGRVLDTWPRPGDVRRLSVEATS